LWLDAATRKRKWHSQAVHHGLWDYDFPAPPNLVTISVDGRKIDAVAQVSKQGFTYVFDRVTGRPVWPIEERPVDTTTDVPGERPSHRPGVLRLRSEEHTSELQSLRHLVCRLLLEKKKNTGTRAGSAYRCARRSATPSAL